MRKERTLLAIGVWVAILPFLGFPEIWRSILFIITGIMLVYLAYLFRLEAKARISKVDTSTKAFVDNINNDNNIPQ